MTKNELNLFQRCLSQHAREKDFNYSSNDRELYDSMKEKIEQVHKSLIHAHHHFLNPHKYIDPSFP